jgi:hypothetical protein
MEFTAIQKEVLAIAYACAGSGNGSVPIEEIVPECEELVEHDWLAREQLDNGDTLYAWTQQAETALDLNQLTSVEGREN